MRLIVLFSTFALPILACSPNGDGRVGRDAGGRDAGLVFDSGSRPDVPPSDDASTSCVADSYAAEESVAPVDIVWVIDNSGSMSEEASLVQEQLNSFVSTIAAAGLDVHVVLITAPGFVTVPPPLGTDPTQFLRVEEDVQSNAALEKLLSTFDRYSEFLRRTAAMHIIAVTDDESEGLSAGEFMSQMSMLLARTYRFHSIVSPPVSPPGSTHRVGPFSMDGCSGPRGDAAANGDQYWMLSALTGGRQLSICTLDWTPLFRELTTVIAVPMALPCVYRLPAPPAGEDLDPLRVNVEYTPGTGGPTETIPNVGSYDRCTSEGWYYEGEDPADPERIVLCPNTCHRLELDGDGRVDLAVGCATLLI